MAIVEPIRIEPQARIVHHADRHGVWATCNRSILFQPAGEIRWRRIGEFPFVLPRDIFAPSRLTSRVLRIDQCNLFPSSGGHLLGIRRGKVYDMTERASGAF